MSVESTLILTYVILLIPYAAFSWAGIYHLWRFGYSSDLSRFFIFFYLTLSILIISTTIIVVTTNL